MFPIVVAWLFVDEYVENVIRQGSVDPLPTEPGVTCRIKASTNYSDVRERMNE